MSTFTLVVAAICLIWTIVVFARWMLSVEARLTDREKAETSIRQWLDEHVECEHNGAEAADDGEPTRVNMTITLERVRRMEGK